MSRLVFLGTPEAAVPPLRALVAAGHEVALVITRPDRRRGRGGATSPSPVKAAATELGLKVGHRLDDAVAVGAELGVVVAYGRLIPAAVLEDLPMINLHFSLLPRWRGAAPVERALLAGDQVTGVCVMAVEEGLDTGGIYARVEVPVGSATLSELRQALVEAGSAMLIEALAHGVAGLGTPAPQVGEPRYAEKLGPEDYRLDWRRPADELDRVVRLGRAFTTWRGQRLGIEAATVPSKRDQAGAPPGTIEADGVVTGSGRLGVTRVRPEGRRSMDFAEWRRGARPGPGELLG